MNLTETQHGDATIVRMTAGPASASLELHRDYYSYYWRCRFGPDEFAQYLHEPPGHKPTILTVVNESTGIQQASSDDAHKTLVDIFNNKDFSLEVTLVRLDSQARSWVWQYAPDDEANHKYSSAVYRDGLAAYAGCASVARHRENLLAANELMSSSAVMYEALADHLHLFELYVTRWETR
jgi:hypothetical protein